MPQLGDEVYLRGDSNRDGSVRILWVADEDEDARLDARLQVLSNGAWVDITVGSPINPNSIASPTMQSAIGGSSGGGGGGTVTDGDKGDINITAGVWRIEDGAVDFDTMQERAEATFIGRQAGAGSGRPQELSATEAKTILALSNVDNTSDANKPISTATAVALALKLPLTPTAAVNFNGQKGINLATPTSDTDAATKGYADALAQGLGPKAAVRAATTANITLSGAQTIDGVAVVAADRVLVKNQTAPAENGIYVVAAGAWSRATDADAWDELVRAYTLVTAGTAQSNSGWVSQTSAGGTLNTTAVTFSQFSAASSGTWNGRSLPTSPQAGDYTATLITNTPAGGIAATTVQAAITELDSEKAPLASPALVTPTRTTQLAAGNSSSALADSAYVQGEIGALVAQAVAEAGTSTATVRWTPERVKQAIVALAPGVNGAGNALAAAVPGAVTLGVGSAAETQIQSQAITLSNAAAKVLVVAIFEAAKDTGTTIRTVTGRVRRGTTNASTQLGADRIQRSQAVASVPFGPFVWAELDAPLTVGPHTYTVRGFVDAGTTITAVRAELRVIELPAAATALSTTTGVWAGTASRTLAAKFAGFVDVKDFGAVGDGSTDDAPAFAAVVAASVRKLFIPEGRYRIASMVTFSHQIIIEGVMPDYAGGVGSDIEPDAGVVAFKMTAPCMIKSLLFRGKLASTTLGGVGLWLGVINKPVLQDVQFTMLDMGLVCDGTQNAYFPSISANYCKIGVYITNDARNISAPSIQIRNYAPVDPANLIANRPYNRSMVIGRLEYHASGGQAGADADTLKKVNRYIPGTGSTFYGKYPSRIQFDAGIIEEYNNDTYNLEINGFWDTITFNGTEITGALTAGALIRVTQTETDTLGVGVLELRGPGFISGSAGGSQPLAVLAQHVNAQVYLSGEGLNFLRKPVYGPYIRRAPSGYDRPPYHSILEGNPFFRDSVARGWVISPGSTTVVIAHDAVNGEMDLTLQDAVGFGVDCYPDFRYDTTNWPVTQRGGRPCQLSLYCTALSAPFIVYMNLDASPWSVALGTVSATGRYTLDFVSPANANLGVRLLCASGGGVTVSFREFFVGIML